MLQIRKLCNDRVQNNVPPKNNIRPLITQCSHLYPYIFQGMHPSRLELKIRK